MLNPRDMLSNNLKDLLEDKEEALKKLSQLEKILHQIDMMIIEYETALQLIEDYG